MTDQQIDEFLEMLAKSPTSARDMVRGLFAAHEAQAEPFGYFRAEPMGWTDCAADDEGAIALYERPAAPAVPMSESQRADLICAVAAICTGTSSRTVAATAIEWTERYYGIVTPAAPSQPADGRGTDAQIKKEREIARHAIVGALAAGYSGQAHPGADHWLAAAHDAGAQIKALEASAAPSQEPINRPQNCGTSYCSCIECVCEPPQPVALTDEEIDSIASKHMSTVGDHWCNEEAIRERHAEDFARAIIAALREKEQKE